MEKLAYDFEFDLLDRKGYRARWLEKKVTEKDVERLEREYCDYLEDVTRQSVESKTKRGRRG